MRIYNQWIDFVNLRSEEYTENSRIPTMVLLLIHLIRMHNTSYSRENLTVSAALLQKFGTPKEDAYRRDLTINRYSYLRQEQE